MSQMGIATRHGTKAGHPPPIFVPAGAIPETLPSGPASAAEGAPECDGETVLLTEIACNGRTFAFNHPLPVYVAQEDGVWTCESPEEYNLLAHGHDRLEAESSFHHVFLYVWDKIACEKDERLTLDAIELKNALLALVKTQN